MLEIGPEPPALTTLKGWLNSWAGAGAVIAGLLLAGCASGLVGPLPKITNPHDAATFVIIRPARFVGGAGALPVTIDGVEVYNVGNGQHVSIPVPAGERIVGAVSWPFFARKEHSQAVNAGAGMTYYFRTDVGGGATLNRISADAAKQLMAETTPVKVE